MALVTGGASGLGRSTVARLTKLGTRVVFCDLQTSAGDQIAKEFGENVTYIPANVTNAHDVQNVIDEIDRIHGRLDVVVNCAGIANAHTTYNFKKNQTRNITTFDQVLKVR